MDIEPAMSGMAGVQGVKASEDTQDGAIGDDGVQATASEQDALKTAPLASSLGYLLRRLQLAFKKHFNRTAGPNSVQPNQVGAMFMIGFNPGITPTQLCVTLGMEGAQVATMLNMLELKGLIARKSSKTDGRSRAVHLTAAGRREFETVQRVALEAEQTFVGDSLSEAETRQLVVLLSRLLAGRPE